MSCHQKRQTHVKSQMFSILGHLKHSHKENITNQLLHQFGALTGIVKTNQNKDQLISVHSKYTPTHPPEGNVLFNDGLNTFYLVIWHQTYDKGKPAAATWATLSHWGMGNYVSINIQVSDTPRQDNTYHGQHYTSRGGWYFKNTR